MMMRVLVTFLTIFIWTACSETGGQDSSLENDGGAPKGEDTQIGQDERENNDSSQGAEDGETDRTETDTEIIDESCEPGTTAECDALDIGYPHGQAVCADNGNWDLAGCYFGDTEVHPYGHILAEDEIKIRYFLNGNRMEDQMYLAMHSAHVLPKAAFRGEYATESFPPTGGNIVNMTYGWHVWTEGEGQLLILQYSSRGMNPISPMVQLIFLTDEVEPGTYVVGDDVAASIIELDATTEYQCVSAVAYGGSVEVTAVKNTTQKEGGSLSYRIPHNIKLYHPSDTPLGDLSEGFADTIEVCPSPNTP